MEISLKKPLWIPSETRVKNSNMFSFMQYVEGNINQPVYSYKQLYKWSVDNVEDFWEAIWENSGIIHSKKYHTILSGKDMFDSKWFEGTELNFAENLLRFRDSHTAIISTREDAPTIKISYSKLYDLVEKCAAGLKQLGVAKGDRVAGFISNIPEAVIAMLATVSIGAIWSSCSPDFGLKGVLDRFGQIQPSVLFAIEEYKYNGKLIDCREKINNIAANIPEIKTIVYIPRFSNLNEVDTASNKFNNKLYFNNLIHHTSKKIEFEQLPFNYPVYIMYSSGTTGVPKCIVHGAGGTLLQHFKELYLHTNVKREDVIFYYTTCGWMMWNWLVSSLFLGASVYLYDGSPAYPNINFLWEKVETNKISIFGTSPKFISTCQKSNLTVKDNFDLSSLHTILSTGAPLLDENFEYIYSYVKQDILLSSISGGTDIISCFMLGSPILPVYAGEIQCSGLGMKVEAYNEKGISVINEKGELVCTKPFPSMPVYFWNDSESKKYKNAYFEHFPGVWRHGDFIQINENGGVIVFGRSDATLNPGGVRIGTAEIYRIVESIEEVSDSLVVGQNWKGDVRIILFVVLTESVELTQEIENKIKTAIRNLATPRHVPAKIITIKEVPRTISGKKVELAVTKILRGQQIDNKDALANPYSLQQFYELDIE